MFEGPRPLEKVNQVGSVEEIERKWSSAHFKEGLRESRNRTQLDSDLPAGGSIWWGEYLLVLQPR